MAGHEARSTIAESAILLLDVRNQLLDERLAAGSVVGRIGEDVMAEATIRIENDVDHLDAAHVGAVAPGDGVSAEVIAAETGDLVDDRIAPARLGSERTRQHNAGSQMRRAPMKGGQELALDVHQLDALRLDERLRFVHSVYLQFHQSARGSIQFTANGLAVGVAGGGAEMARATVEIHDGLNRVGVFVYLRHRQGEGQRVAVENKRLAGLPIPHVLGEERFRLKPIGTGAEFLDVLFEQHDVDAAAERLRRDIAGEGEVERQRARLRGGDGRSQQNRQTGEAANHRRHEENPRFAERTVHESEV